MRKLSNGFNAAVALAIALGLGVALPGCGGDKNGKGAAASHAPAGGPGTVAVKQSSAREAIETYCLACANLDTDALGAIVAPECRKPVVDMMTNFAQQLAKHRELADLAEAKFGKDLADSMRDELKDVNKDARDRVDNGKAVWAKIDLKEEADKASATLVGQNNPVRLVLIKDKWYITVPEWESKSAQIKAEADRQGQLAAEKIARANELIAKVRAGQITDRKQFQDAVKDLKFRRSE